MSEAALTGQKTSLTVNKETLTVRDAVFDLLRELDMRTMFGNPGSTELAFLLKTRKANRRKYAANVSVSEQND